MERQKDGAAKRKEYIFLFLYRYEILFERIIYSLKEKGMITSAMVRFTV